MDRDASAPGEERFRQLLDTAPDAMLVVGADGRIEFVNLQTERMFGYARAELLGQHLDLLLPERFRQGHGAHLTRFFASPSARTMGSGIDLFGRRKDGSELSIEVSLSPMRSASGVTVSAAIRDTSERKRMEAANRLLGDRLASAVESMTEGFALFDHEDRLVLCNSVYRRIVGESVHGPIVGKSYEELLDSELDTLRFSSPGEREQLRADRLLRRSDFDAQASEVLRRDGRILRVIDRRTAEGGVVSMILDLTEDVRLAEELSEAHRAADAASRAKSEFLASMSHELRTPMNAILGFAQLLQRDRKEPLSDRHKERVAQILKGGEHLLRLINDILDLARIEAGGVSIVIEPVSVPEILGETVAILEPLAAKQGIAIEVEPLPAELPLVAADRGRFSQILLNFGTNAIKYNRPAGTVSFVVSTSPAAKVSFVVLAVRPELVRVMIRDTGVGIPLDRQSKIFQPFQRAGQETGPIEGTGIGLVITARLAHMMGGHVGFRSVPGEGSEFWVDIPVHEAASRTSEPIVPREIEPERFVRSERKLILYVEDSPANVTFMKDLIGTLGDCDLLTASTAEVGLELAREHHPDLIIMDINLPGMSGLDALRVLQGTPGMSETPIIALTAAASERDRKEGLRAGFYRYLTKPVKVDEFIAALDGLFSPP